MDKHKSMALEDKCKCTECLHRFECFTQERVFTDPIFQGLFEALLAQGLDRDLALATVTNEIRARMPHYPSPEPQPINPINPPWIHIGGGTVTAPNSNPWYDNVTDITTDWWTTSDNVAVSCSKDCSSDYNITYTLTNGEEISWNADSNWNYKAR